MSDAEQRRAKGAEVFKTVYAGVLDAGDKPTGDDFFEIMIQQTFGEIWSRETLSLRDRRLITMGAIAALGEKDVFGIQVTTGLNTGHFTPEQVREMIIHFTHYIGYPRAAGIRGAAEAAIHQWQKAQSEKAE